MFRSAIVKLTAWYLLIIVCISIAFSVAIYQTTANEVDARLERFQTILQNEQPTNNFSPSISTREKQSNEAAQHIFVQLLYANLAVLITGGILSYLLARKTLRPIEEAHEAQSRFTSDASHELRTPLAAMKAELEVTLRDPATTRYEMREILVSNLEEVEKLSRLSEMLLNLSRLEHDKLDRSVVDIEATTKAIIHRLTLTEKRVALTTNGASHIEGNQPAIEELVTILIDNAVKYSPADSLIHIKITRQSKYTSFTITNSGAGIAEDKLPHIFDRFYRADTSRTGGDARGHGLGLALAKKIVELHKGELRVSSAAKQDTTFTLLLPKMQDNQS